MLMHLLNRSIADGISRNCEPDDIISLFSQFITDRANPYFEKHYSQRNERYFCHENGIMTNAGGNAKFIMRHFIIII